MVAKNSEAPMAATIEASKLPVNHEKTDMTSLAIADRTINVPFHGTNLFLVGINNEPYVPMKPVVEGMGMVWAAQFVKLKQRFAKGISEIEIPSAGGKQLMTCLAFRKFAAWLSSIQPNKVRPEIREKVIQYQEECDDVLYEYWTKGHVVNPRKAKKALLGKITTEQQEAIKQLVMSRGQSLPKEKQAKAMITMWSSLKSHFGCSYKEISEEQFTEALSLAARVPLEGELIGKQEKSTNEFSAKEANSLVWLWDYANRSQALFRELYPALKQIQSNYSGRCYDYGHEFSYVIGMARDVLINHTRDIDINEPDGPTNLSAWVRLKNKELPPSLHHY
ncbi:antirepressor protein [Escherichia coli]|uniref:Antirepressor protein Ant n=3 Tax=Escherichia coli TaxID=562 RepID=A0AAN3UZB2_ECOLX|nr:antirepressor protein Ant [Escherichia coli 4.0967]CTS68692.1 antirepressor protein [Escherichia coli]CTU38341.1 antirepressor protein [Escherichia coli]CTZ39913.1 antirepressor protein [Escherichia coli]CTZ81803.1 antirepressor protein [Escherichia coli]